MVLLLFNHLKLIPAFCREPTTVHPSHTKMARTHRFLKKKKKKNYKMHDHTQRTLLVNNVSDVFTALMPELETHVVRKESLRLPED